jgi:hypothetical protein
MCLLLRQDGVLNMKHWGFNVAVVQDLIEVAYSPYDPPYVDIATANDLQVQYIQKWAAPTLKAADFVTAYLGC